MRLSRERTVTLLFVTRFLRLFNYGAISVVLFSYIVALGFSEFQTGVLLTGILVGDFVMTLPMTSTADNVLGRRTTLVLGSLLKVFAGSAFALATDFWVLVLAGVFGVISSSGGEIGPFLAVEQACLTDVAVPPKGAEGGGKHAGSEVATLFGWYNALGYGAQALGAVTAGVAVEQLRAGWGWSEVDADRTVFYVYAAVGGLMALLYTLLSPEAEARPSQLSDASPRRPMLNLGLRRPESRSIVARLSALFALDAFAGAFIMQTWMAFWFSRRWGFSPDLLGSTLMAANIVSGISGVAASVLVKRIGAINTMVVTHLPSNVLLIFVALMPSGVSAALMLVVRSCISQMDVPARQAYVAMVVASDERSAAGGLTNIARSVGMFLAPTLVGLLSSQKPSSFWFSAPFYIAGVLKIIYDVTLWAMYHLGSSLKENEAAAVVSDQTEAALQKAPLAEPLLTKA